MEAGKIWIRVIPNTKNFRPALEKHLQRLERQVIMKIRATVDADYLLAQAQKATKAAQAALGTLDVRATVEAQTARAKTQIAALERSRDIDVNVDLDATAAATRIAVLTRTRRISIWPVINKAALAAAAASLAALKAVGAASAISSVGALAVAAVGQVLAFGSALASIAPVALALPGLLVGAGVGVGVLVAVLKDLPEVLGDLGPQFSALQDSMSSAFWDRAAGPIREMVGTVLPALSGVLTEIAGQFGGWAVAISSALADSHSIAVMTGFLENMRDAVDLAGDGIGAFVAGLINLAGVGSAYMGPPCFSLQQHGLQL